MATPGIRHDRFRIPVTAQEDLCATRFRTDAEPTGVVLVHPATATPQGFYRGFAEHAAAAGLVVLTYDYRGTGLSGISREHPRLRMRDWIEQDVPAVARWAAGQYPGMPHYAVGHSVGGHALVLNQGTDHLLAGVIVASHVAALHSIEAPAERLRVAFILTVLGPALGRMLGYVPGRRLGLGEDIPTGVVDEWRRWILKYGYFFDDPSMRATERSAQTTLPLLAVGASDDPWASPRQMDSLVSHLTSARVQRETVGPQDLGVERIGHHGLLRRGVAEREWDAMLAWLVSHRQ